MRLTCPRPILRTISSPHRQSRNFVMTGFGWWLLGLCAVGICFPTQAQYRLKDPIAGSGSLSGTLELMNGTHGPYSDQTPDMTTLRLRVECLPTGPHIRIDDPAQQRYEVPNIAMPAGDPLNPCPFYELSYTEEPFTLTLARPGMPNEIIWQSLPGLCFEDQFIEWATQLGSRDTAIYGLGERAGALKANLNKTYTIFTRDNGGAIADAPLYGAHPVWMDIQPNGKSHGGFMLNSNAMDVVLTPGSADSDTPATMTWRLTGGILDLYLYVGPTPHDVIRQHAQIVGRPAFMPMWALGWQQCKWGYETLDQARAVVEAYRANDIPLEVQWADIDYMAGYRDFTFDPVRYPQAEVAAFVAELHRRGQRWVPIVDPAIKAEAGHEPFVEGVAKGLFIQDHSTGLPLVEVVWPGNTTFPDFSNPDTHTYWRETYAVHLLPKPQPAYPPDRPTQRELSTPPMTLSILDTLFSDLIAIRALREGSARPVPSCWAAMAGLGWAGLGWAAWCSKWLRRLYEMAPWDGIWIDMNEPAIFGDQHVGDFLNLSGGARPPASIPEPARVPIYPPPYAAGGHPPFEGAMSPLAVQQVSRAMRARSGAALHPHSLWHDLQFPCCVLHPPALTPGCEFVHWPARLRFVFILHLLPLVQPSPSAVLVGWLQDILPGQRPFIISRSTYAGSGRYTMHWLGSNPARDDSFFLLAFFPTGDNFSTYTSLWHSITGTLAAQLFGIPFVGADICGNQYDATPELCTRWIALGALYPFSRDHSTKGTSPQEPYAFGEPYTSINRQSINLKYSLLSYLYTLLEASHRTGAPVWDALAWVFPEDMQTHDQDTQFMVGEALLASPCLEMGETTVDAYLPPSARWYDFATGLEVSAPGGWKTLPAPLSGSLPLHIRGGFAIPIQSPRPTVAETSAQPIKLVVALDEVGAAQGTIYLDDGTTAGAVETGAYLRVSWTVANGSLEGAVKHSGYAPGCQRMLQNVTILGLYPPAGGNSTLVVDPTPCWFAYGPQTGVLELRLPDSGRSLCQDLRLAWSFSNPGGMTTVPLWAMIVISDAAVVVAGSAIWLMCRLVYAKRTKVAQGYAPIPEAGTGESTSTNV
ncbi:putative Sucrase-isomaltase; intestinal [Paratrimastix pyriformis]|uniref:Maltase n=1 Tax=Paratrimastix pyriformis TaxID=342808 RepID=A0ABQ8UFK0_9EUKA|nr:putative Sucrase-isomaltase; intestinal [Paratrimastix pyriformis]